MCSLNFENQLSKARRLLFSWSNRTLTINGKITIIKSQILPLFTHLFVAIPDPDKDFFKKLNTLFYKFIWYGKRDKIKRSMLINDHKNGGLKMIDPLAFCRYLKITWIKRLITSDGLWQTLTNVLLDNFGNNVLFKFENKQLLRIAKHISNLFWRDVVSNYAMIRNKVFDSKAHFIDTPLLNFVPPKDIKLFLNWHNNGLSYIRDLILPNGEIKTFKSLQREFNLHGDYILYFRLINYIPRSWLRKIKDQRFNIDILFTDSIFTKLKDNKSCKFIYNIYLQSITSNLSRISYKWSQKLNSEITEEFLSTCFELIPKITIESKTRSAYAPNFNNYYLFENLWNTN
jgi:hypothetical protein